MTKVGLFTGAGVLVLGVFGGTVATQFMHSSEHTTDDHNVVHNHHAEAEYAPHKHHGKPGAQVMNENTTEYFLNLHEQKSIELALHTEHTHGQLQVHVEADEGLMLTGAQNTWEYTLEGAQDIQIPVTVYGASEGRHLVHIFVTHTNEYGQVSSRALAQRVDVGVSSTQVQRYHSQAKTVAPYVKLPAQEVIN